MRDSNRIASTPELLLMVRTGRGVLAFLLFSFCFWPLASVCHARRRDKNRKVCQSHAVCFPNLSSLLVVALSRLRRFSQLSLDRAPALDSLKPA